MSGLRSIAAIAGLIFVAGCAVGPAYHRPEMSVPAAFKEAWQPAAPADGASRGPWWQAYSDPTLDALEQSAQKSNQTLRAADAQYRAAAAAVGGARAALFPALGASVSTARSSNPSGSGAAGGGAGAAGQGVTTVDRVSGSVDWEVDLWGRLRRQLGQSRANAEASAGDLAAAQLSVAATLAQDYVQLRALDVQLGLLSRTITAYHRSLVITSNRYAAGVAPRTDLTQAQSQLAGAQAQAAELRVQRAPLEHAIAVLTGSTPEQFTLAAASTLPALPPVPAVLPATLLQRRPDVAAAERRVAAANAAISVARGAYFPSLTLSAAGGYQGPAWQHLLSAPQRYWSLGPALAATLFDAGARQAASRAAGAYYDQAVANYRATVLAALQSAEDALANLRDLDEEQAATERSAAAARETLRITENQYRAGTVGYLNVVIAQGTSLSAESSLINVQGRRLLAHIALIRAMGGGPQH